MVFLPRRCCGASRGTGPSSSSPTAGAGRSDRRHLPACGALTENASQTVQRTRATISANCSRERTLRLHADPQVLAPSSGEAPCRCYRSVRHHRHHRRGAPQPVRSARRQHAAALPNAAFIGFTGTPLIAGQEERTREVFGDYVSIYNFAQSIADGATVPLYYEARKPELQLARRRVEGRTGRPARRGGARRGAGEAAPAEFARQYHLITRDDRLDEDRSRPRAPLLGARLSRQGDVRRHRQGDGRAHVRQGRRALGG